MYEKIPDELKRLNQWVCFRKEPDRKKPGRMKKLPIDAKTGKPAKSNDPSTWCSFSEALRMSGQYDGIGFMFANGYFGVDIDHVEADIAEYQAGSTDNLVYEMIQALQSYAEYSISGKGLHIICKGKLPDGKRRRGNMEMYQSGRFFVMTGNAAAEYGEIRDCTEEIKALHEKYMSLEPINRAELARQVYTSGLPDDRELLDKILSSRQSETFKLLFYGGWENTYGSPSEADMALCNILAFWCGKDMARMDRFFRVSSLYRDKWNRMTGAQTYGELTMRKAIQDCKEVYQEQNSSSPQEDFSGYLFPDSPSFFAGKRFLHNALGDYLIKTAGVGLIGGTLHVYQDGIYTPDADTLYRHMTRLLPSISDARRKEVFKYLKYSEKTPVRYPSPPELIPLKSNIYDIEKNRYLEYAPDFVFLNRFPYDYTETAPESPKLKNTLFQIANEDEEILSLILEAFGNCFFRQNRYRGAVLLYGSGFNGKSTLLNMLTQLIGKENASFLSMQDTTERFLPVEVYGKAVNIGDDIPETFISDSAVFKKLVTGETFTAQRKYEASIAFESYAKMFFAANTLPVIRDKSKGMLSRLLLIPLNHDFSGRNQPDLKHRRWSKADMEYLTRISLEGLKRLMRNGQFTKPESVEAALRQYELENNPVLGFLDEYEKELEGLPTGEVYFDFRMWCGENGHRNLMTRTRFSREVCQVLGMTTALRRHIRAGGNATRCFTKM